MTGRITKARKMRTAQHRPATKKRRYRHDDLIAVDLFSGFGGLTQGIERAGFTTILAANHNEYKTQVHERNHPHAEHWIADLVDPDAADYHSARDLPAGDIVCAGVSCVNHSLANSQRAYEQQGTLFGNDDEEYEARVTRSERDRATANCVLHYAETHHPRLILVECTTQLSSWGPLVQGGKKIGDGSTYRWWLRQFENLGYKHRVLYLNSMFFGVPQSRDRGYWVFWDKNLPDPDLDHRPESWCDRCQTIVQAVWSWKTRMPPTGTVYYGKQYNYRCPSCRHEVIPPFAPSLDAIDLTNLGTKIGDRPYKTHRDGSFGPLALATLDRAERCRQRFADFPAILMPAKGVHGTERHLLQPMSTQTSQQETAILSTGALMALAGNTYERPGSNCRVRDLTEPMPTQTATNGTGLITPPIALHGQVMAAHRHNGDGKHLTQPMDTITSTHEKAVLLAVDNYQGVPRGADQPLPTQGGSETLGILSTGVMPFRKHTIPTTHAEAMPTVTADQIPGLLTAAGGITGAPERAFLIPALAEWGQALAQTPLLECYLRMLGSHEIGRGCGFDPDFGAHQGTFIVWGSERDRVDGYGNAVSPPVGEWISDRLRRSIHSEVAA
jgi:DNA (cytosine-5)-methyltransferase 1